MIVSAYSIVVILSVLWYLGVLGVWVWLGQSMSLFGDHSVLGWFMIAAAFVFSLVANLLLNPLAWIIAIVSLRTARAEGTTSIWRFYPPMFGFLLIVSMIASVFVNIAQTKKTGTWNASAPGLLNVPSFSDDSTSDEHALIVSGIMFYGDPSALVNGHVLKKGDKFNGFEVVEVRENSVLFSDEDGEIFEERVK